MAMLPGSWRANARSGALQEDCQRTYFRAVSNPDEDGPRCIVDKIRSSEVKYIVRKFGFGWNVMRSTAPLEANSLIPRTGGMV